MFQKESIEASENVKKSNPKTKSKDYAVSDPGGKIPGEPEPDSVPVPGSLRLVQFSSLPML